MSNTPKYPRLERLAISAITPAPYNPRKISDEAKARLALQMSELGNLQPIVFNVRTKTLIGGHQRLRIYQEQGVKAVEAWCVDLPADKEKAANLALNNFNGEWDGELLGKLVEEVKLAGLDIALTGFEEKQLAALLEELTPAPAASGVDAEPQMDRAEELRKKWKTKRGQVWQLGDHRLMCGDCREDADVDKLLAGKQINVAFTSPPYAAQRDYDESSGFKPIPPDEFVQWFDQVQGNVRRHLAVDGSWFVNIKPCADGLDTHLYVLDLVIAHVRQWQWHFATEFCWERNGVPKSVTRRFKNQFEPVYQFALGDWKMRPDNVRHYSDNVPIPFGKGAGNTSWKTKQGGNGAMFGGQKRGSKGRTMSSVQGTEDSCFECSAPGMAFPGNRLPTFAGTHEAVGHAAAFPVGLPQWFIKAYSDAGDIVFEPFSGSGSTIIASESEGRVCCAMEISPAYVAVAIQRWADATGKTPKRLP